MPVQQRSRRGFTLIEVTVSMMLMLFVLGAATTFFQSQGKLIAETSGRLDAQQTAQFALTLLDRELRLAGVGVADMQPVIVQAAPMAITFNADLVSIVPGDPSTVYVDPDADPNFTSVFRSTQKRALPTSSQVYPDSTHMRSAGAPSGAETISFWLSADSSTTLANDYILWRRVNHGPAQIVATSVMKSGTDTVFQYFRGDSAGNLTAIQGSSLPLYHNAQTHGAKSDTGRLAWVDSIHTIRVRLRIAFQSRKGPVYRRLDQTIRLMNAGLVRRSTCGEPPIGVMPVAVASLDTLGQPLVTITWPKSSDEGGGERDIERYALYKRPAALGGSMNEPFASIPAGSPSYAYADTDVRSGEAWVYGVASQDCTPLTSGVGTTATVVIP